jgi:hypothetical protein
MEAIDSVEAIDSWRPDRNCRSVMYNYAAELNWPTESDMYMNGSILAESHIRRFTLPASAMPAIGGNW